MIAHSWDRRGGFDFVTATVLLLFALALGACAGNDPNEKLAKAKAYQEKGELSAAVLELKSVLQEHPEHAESRLYLGSLYSAVGDYRSAEKELTRARELNVDAARVLPELAKVLVLQGAARRVLAEVSPDAVSDPDAVAAILAARGLAHLSLRQNAEAKSDIDKALSLRPRNVEALLGRARLLAVEGRIEDALKEVDSALASSSKSIEGHMLKGDLLRAAGRADDARAAYQAVVDQQPGHVNASLALVSLAIASGKLDEATDRLAAVRKAAPGAPMASYFQALISFRKGDFKAAQEEILAVLRVAPTHLPSLLLGGAAEFALGAHELAQTRLRFVLEKAPGNAYARRLLAASYARSGQTQKALELLEPVLKQGTKDPALFALGGEVYMQLGDYERAQKYFEQAAALDPKNAAMRTGLGLSRLAVGDVESATAELESASGLDSSKNHADVLLVATYLRQRQYAQALKAARVLEAKQPNNPMSYNVLAAAHIGNKDFAGARRSLEKALALQPGYTPAAMNLAQLDLHEGNKAAARKRLEDIIARDRTNVEAYLGLVSLAPRIDARPSEVQQWLETARRESPSSIRPLVMLARLYLQMNDSRKALQAAEDALGREPSNPEVLDLAGQVQLAAGEKNRALATFAKWVAEQPSPAAHFRLATAQLANHDLHAAGISLRNALSLRPHFPEAQVLLAHVEAKSGRRDDALRIAAALQKQSPNVHTGWVLEGDLNLRERLYGPALVAYERAAALGITGSLIVKLHETLTHLGRGEEAERRVKDWLSSQPQDSATRMYLAESYLKAGQYPKAIAEYESLVGQMPQNVVALNNLAWGYHQAKDKRAIITAERALEISPDNAAVMDTYGWILFETGDEARGLDLLKKAVGLAQNSPEIRFHYAEALARAKQRQKAKEELERLLLEFPEFPGSERALKLLGALRAE